VSLRVTNTATPTFNSTLYSYTGNHNPPDRGDFTTVNESSVNTGNSTDGTAYGYYFDRANDTIYFYVVKSQIYGNLLDPGDSTLVYADTWYVNNRHQWRNYDKQPGRPKSYTMVPEFSDIIAPLAGTVALFALLKRRVAPGRRNARRTPGCGPQAAGGRRGWPVAAPTVRGRQEGGLSP